MIVSEVVSREFIGRESELAFLLQALGEHAGRRSALVAVRGEAGIGKTRLVAEFAAAARAAGVRTAVAAAREYANAPYAIVADAFEELGIAAPFAERSPADGEGDERSRRFALAASHLSTLARAAERGLAVAFEDVQWADGATIDLLRYLAQRLAAEPVLLVVTFRTDEAQYESARMRALAALERDAAGAVALEPLRGDQVDKLLRAMIKQGGLALPGHLVPAIRELSDGRPLFAEELLRGTLERASQFGEARPEVPAGIRTTVRERLGTLEPDEREVLFHAAVIGRRFSARFLAAVSEFGRAVILGALRKARDLGLVVEGGDADGDAFAFRHALTREVVYSELLRAEVRELHARVASALARESVLDLPAIAEHAYRAGDREHALAWNERAGDRAAELFAHLDAARHFERAFESADDAQQRAGLAVKSALAWYANGDVERSVEWFSQAVEALPPGDPAAARLTMRRARVLWEFGRYDQSIAETRALADSLDAQAEPALRFEVSSMLAGLLVPRGFPDQALAHLTAVEPLLAHADPEWAARYQQISGYALGMLGRTAQARERFALAIAGARACGDDDVLVRALNNGGNVELAAGTLDAARELYASALELAERTKNRRVAAWLSQNGALAALAAGDLGEARRLLARSAEIAHDVPLLHRWRAALALRLATLAGEPREAERAQALADLAEALGADDRTVAATLAGALALDALADGRDGPAAAAVARVMPRLERAEPPLWLFTAAARGGGPDDRRRSRALLAAAAASTAQGPAQAALALHDAREAQRRRRRPEAVERAQLAAGLFGRAGWAFEQAEALEIAGAPAEALARYRAAGALAEVRRLTETAAAPRRRGDASLTGREREIVGLVLDGRSARAIADLLFISERTVETHVASAYRKLGVTSRGELAAALAESIAHP